MNTTRESKVSLILISLIESKGRKGGNFTGDRHMENINLFDHPLQSPDLF